MAKSEIGTVLKRFVSENEQLDRVLSLSISGILHASKAVELEEALANWESVSGRELPEGARDMEAVRARATFAQGEIDAGFPVLHGQACVARWGLLEATIEDLVVCLLLTEPALRAREEWQRIRVPLAEYDSLDEEDRMRLLVREYARSSSADLKVGVTRFETLLTPVGMSGPVDDEVRRDLFELSQVRNLLVHRAGKVDRKFCDACPWLGQHPGDLLRISHLGYLTYRWATQEYFTDLLERDLVRSGTAAEKAAAVMADHRQVRPPASDAPLTLD